MSGFKSKAIVKIISRIPRSRQIHHEAVTRRVSDISFDITRRPNHSRGEKLWAMLHHLKRWQKHISISIMMCYGCPNSAQPSSKINGHFHHVFPIAASAAQQTYHNQTASAYLPNISKYFIHARARLKSSSTFFLEASRHSDLGPGLDSYIQIIPLHYRGRKTSVH